MVVQDVKFLLDDVIPLPQVFDKFVVLIQQLTHQDPILLGLSFETISLNAPLLMKLNHSFQGNVPFDVCAQTSPITLKRQPPCVSLPLSILSLACHTLPSHRGYPSSLVERAEPCWSTNPFCERILPTVCRWPKHCRTGHPLVLVEGYDDQSHQSLGLPQRLLLLQ